MKLKTKDIVFREDLYPRLKKVPATIQTYSENIDQLPPIEVNQHRELLDGYHRWKAHETAGEQEIEAVVTETKSDAEAKLVAIERNAKHGQQLTREEKITLANRLFGDVPEEVICKVLAISRRTFDKYTASKAKQRDEEVTNRVLEMHLACYDQQEIANTTGMSVQFVSKRIAENSTDGNSADYRFFRDFEQDGPKDSGRRIYTVWNFPKANNEVRHFGNIPPEIIDNLLYL